jgi:hypothetical protein
LKSLTDRIFKLVMNHYLVYADEAVVVKKHMPRKAGNRLEDKTYAT